MTDGDGRPPLGEAVVAIILVFLAVVVIVEGHRLGLGDGRRPGAGLAPVIVGYALAAAGLGCGLRVVRLRRALGLGRAGDEDYGSPPAPENRFARLVGASGKPAIAATLVAAYLFAMRPVGYLLATLGFATAFLLLMGWRGWKVPVAGVTVAMTSWLLFDVLLGVPLPGGLLD